MTRQIPLTHGSSYFHMLGLFTLVAILVPAVLSAQQSGSINGTVVDPSRAAVPAAELVLTNIATGITRQAVSSAQGYFNFSGLSAAQYSLRVTAKGFKVFNMNSLTLNVGQQMTVTPVLQLGASRQVVNVTTAPPTVTTSSASIQQTVESRQLENLPLNGRNPLQLLALTPGVISEGSGGQFGMVQLHFSTPGARISDVNYTLNGGTNNDMHYNLPDTYPNPDALREFTVVTRDVSATLGRGSTEVLAQVKSGTNQFHGSAFEFNRNTSYDARSFFAPQVSFYQRNQFGGTLGGPIIKNRLFFFVAYQGTKENGAPGVTEYQTLTPAERMGDFSSLSKTLTNPAGGTFAGNIIPTASITKFSLNYMEKQLPLPNAGNFYMFNPVNTLDQNQLIGHTDFEVDPKDRISFLYFLDNIPEVVGRTTATSAAQASIFPTRHQNFTLQYTHIFSPSLLNQFTATYDRDAYGVTDPASSGFPLFDQLGLDINVGDAVSAFGLTGQSHMTVTGYWSDVDAVPVRNRMANSEIQDMMTWVHGAHTIDFGTQIYKNYQNEIQNFLTNGSLSFTGYATGNAAADFLLGEFGSYNQQSVEILHAHQTLPSFYFQDNFRATRGLTLSLGLRWDMALGWTEQDKELATFIPGEQSTLFPLAPPGLLYPGDHGLPQSIVGNRLNNFAPRVGIAWDVFGNGKTALRASGGMFYVPTTQGQYLNDMPSNPPFDNNALISHGNLNNLWAGAPYNGVNPFPYPLPGSIAQLQKVAFPPYPTTDVFGLPFKTEVNQEWSLSVQQAIGANGNLEIAYLGSSGSHEFTPLAGNPAVYIPGQSTASSANIQSRRIYPYMGYMESDGNSLSSNYNALEVTFRKRYSHHIMFLTTYTWSNALGIDLGDTGGSHNDGTRDPFNRALDYGRLPSNVSQNWVSSFIWDVPFGKHLSSPILRTALAGWQADAINTVYTGFPFSANAGTDTPLNGDTLATADLIGNPSLPGGRSKGAQILEWFNTAAFAKPATGTYGTAGQDILTAPGKWDTDFGLYKVFKIREGVNLQIRGQFYNVFNHTNLGFPNSSLSSVNFGRILSTGDPRVIELGAHLEF